MFGIGAYPNPIRVKSGNSFTYITLKGNENIKYAVTDDGFYVIQDSEGWKYLKLDDDGNVTVSEYLLGSCDSRSKKLELLKSDHFVSQVLNSEHLGNLSVDVTNVDRQQSPVVGNRRVLIVMMQFTDCSFSKTRNDFHTLFNEPGYSVDGAEGSVYDYYRYVSYGQLNLQCDIIGPFTASHDMAYYGKNVGLSGRDKNPYALFTEALQYASSQVSLSDYDANCDGIVDNFHIIYAGYGEEAGASSDAIWAHESTFEPVFVSGLKIDRYSCAPELRSNRGNGISRIGPHCHEIGHALGAMDFYDTDYADGGNYTGTGKWDVMASGSWNNDGISPANFNSYVKAYDFGWMNIVSLNTDTNIVVKSSVESNIIYRLDTPVKDEYFLIENRRMKQFDRDVPGEGLLLLHVGSNIKGKSNTNSINATFPQNCYIVCASSKVALPSSSPSTYGDINSAGCPFPGSSNNNSFTPLTVPGAICVNGTSANFSILDIEEHPNEDVSFHFYASQDSISVPDDDSDIPLDGKIVWEEDFKGWLLPDGWLQECQIGNVSWQKRMSSKESTVHYVELAYENSPWEPKENIICTCLKTPLIDIAPTNYVLSFDINCVSQNNIPDTLIVTNGYGETICKNAVFTGSWTTKNLIIRESQLPIQLSFWGVVHNSSAIRITNVRIRELNVNNIYNVEIDKVTPTVNYDLSGRMMNLQYGFRRFKLAKTQNGLVKKILEQ